MAAIHGRFTRSQILIQNGMDSGDCALFSCPPQELIPRNPLVSLFHLPLHLPVRMGTWSSEQGTCGNGSGLHAPSPNTYK